MAAKGMLLDMGKCIGCRSCQVACKQWNGLPAEKTKFFAAEGGYQNPAGLSPKTYGLVKFYEATDEGRLQWLFRVHSCLHCVDPACVKACPVTPVKAMTHVKETGSVYVNRELCVGCGACHEYCPWNIPQIDPVAEKSTKCTLCVDRVTNGLEPACAKACPTGAIAFGDYNKILDMARQAKARLQASGRHPRIYGEKELGTGTRKIYVLPAGLDFYPDLPKSPSVPDDLGLLQEFLRPMGTFALTAAVVGLVIAKVKEVREEQRAKSTR